MSGRHWMSWLRQVWTFGDLPITSYVADQPTALADQPSSDPDWVLAKAYIRERLVSLRRHLETVGMPIETTEGARTAIIELEGVLNFRKPSKMSENASE